MQYLREIIIPTDASAPEHLAVYRTQRNKVSALWKHPAGEVKKYHVVCRNDEIVKELSTTDTNITVSNLVPGTRYTLEVSTEFADGSISEPASIHAYTGGGN